MKSNNVILFEHKYHEELLLPQIRALIASNIHVHLICSNKIGNSASLNSVRQSITIQSYANTASLLTKLRLLWLVPRYAKKKNIDAIIINTLDSNLCRALLKRLSFIRRIAILHNADKFIKGSCYAHNLKYIDCAFTLTNYIAEFLEKNNIYAKPVLLADFGHTSSLKEPDQTINIVIPGQIDFTRRDYISLLNITGIPSNIRFVLLGNASKNDGPELIKRIKAEQLESRFLWFEHYIEHDDFIEHIANADIIMPLLHPQCDSYDKYRTCKSSAAFMWSKAFLRPMLLENGFKPIKEYQLISAYYDIKQLGNALPLLVQRLADLQIFLDPNDKNSYVNEIRKVIGQTGETGK